LSYCDETLNRNEGMCTQQIHNNNSQKSEETKKFVQKMPKYAKQIGAKV
jgi:hypothetical protein